MKIRAGNHRGGNDMKPEVKETEVFRAALTERTEHLLSFLPCTLQLRKHPCAPGGRACRQPQRCGDGNKSFHLLGCSSAHTGSQLPEEGDCQTWWPD